MDLVGPSHIEEHFIDAFYTCCDVNATGIIWVELGSGAGFRGLLWPFTIQMQELLW